MNTQSTVKTALGWCGTAFFTILTLYLFFQSFSFVSLMLGMALVALCAPPSREWLRSRNFPEFEVKQTAILFGLVITAQLVFSTVAAGERAVDAAKHQRIEAARKLEARREADKAHYLANRATVLSDIQSLRENSDFAGADAALAKYKNAGVTDSALTLAAAKLEAAKARAKLKDENSLSLEERASVYKILSEDAPQDLNLAAKSKALSAELSAKVEKEAVEAARLQALERRRANIKSQFSSWDGSHQNLERAIKNGMNNPKSYEHVETRFLDTGKAIIVTTRFRGTNAFGGIVSNSVVAEVDEQGNILSLERLK